MLPLMFTVCSPSSIIQTIWNFKTELFTTDCTSNVYICNAMDLANNNNKTTATINKIIISVRNLVLLQVLKQLYEIGQTVGIVVWLSFWRRRVHVLLG